MTSTYLLMYANKEISELSWNLSEFFRFYGDHFDQNKQGMDGTNFFTLSKEQQQMQDSLWVLDIQNRDNNTAKSAFRFNDIKEVFLSAYNLMKEEK